MALVAVEAFQAHVEGAAAVAGGEGCEVQAALDGVGQ